MRIDYLFPVLTLAGLTGGCGHHHDDKEWTKEDLAELEAKWGFDVSSLSYFFLLYIYSPSDSGHSVASAHSRTSIMLNVLRSLLSPMTLPLSALRLTQL